MIDTDSFSPTVENVFYMAFSMRDGLARMKTDQNKPPVIEPFNIKKVNEVTRTPRFRNKDICAQEV